MGQVGAERRGEGTDAGDAVFHQIAGDSVKHKTRHALPEPGSTAEATAEAAVAGRESAAVARKTKESPAAGAAGEAVGRKCRTMIRTHQ
jgi:hypothetical protein